MRRSSISLAALLCVSLWSATSEPKPNRHFVMIVNWQNPMTELTGPKVKMIFLRRISRWPWGAETRPMDLTEVSVLRREFTKDLLGTTPAELAVYWIDQKATRNVDPPEIVPTVEAVKAIVAAQPGAIAYIPTSALDNTVKLLEIVR